ncbi:MAG: hypothetical protein U0R50_09175 [Gaiellales bacterium]
MSEVEHSKGTEKQFNAVAKLLAIFGSWDFVAGLVAGGVVFWLTGPYPDLVSESETIYVAVAAIGAGVLGVVLAALAVLVTFFDDLYRLVVSKTTGGFDAALFPYKVVAGLGGLCALVALGSLAASSQLSNSWGEFCFAVVLGLVTWTIVAMYQLVAITLHHGIARAKLHSIPEDMLALLQKRKTEQDQVSK